MIDGKKELEIANGYRDISYNIAGQAWCVAGATPHFLDQYYGRWKAYPLPIVAKGKHLPETSDSIGIDTNGNGWVISGPENLYFFDLEKGEWRLIRRPPGTASKPQNMFQMKYVRPSPTGAYVATNATTEDDPGSDGTRIIQLKNGQWSDLGAWFITVTCAETGDDVWALNNQRRIRKFTSSAGSWSEHVFSANDGVAESFGADICASDRAIYLLSNDRRRLWRRNPDGTCLYRETDYIAGDFPSRLSGAPGGKGILVFYENDGGFFKFSEF